MLPVPLLRLILRKHSTMVGAAVLPMPQILVMHQTMVGAAVLPVPLILVMHLTMVGAVVVVQMPMLKLMHLPLH